MASRERDDAMAGLLKRTLAGDAGAGDDCPGPDILAAYFERSLDADETAHVELHLSECARCREQLAALGRAEEAAATPIVQAPRNQPRASWLWDWRWLAPVAAVLDPDRRVGDATSRAHSNRGAANTGVGRKGNVPTGLASAASRQTTLAAEPDCSGAERRPGAYQSRACGDLARSEFQESHGLADRGEPASPETRGFQRKRCLRRKSPVLCAGPRRPE